MIRLTVIGEGVREVYDALAVPRVGDIIELHDTHTEYRVKAVSHQLVLATDAAQPPKVTLWIKRYRDPFIWDEKMAKVLQFRNDDHVDYRE